MSSIIEDLAPYITSPEVAEFLLVHYDIYVAKNKIPPHLYSLVAQKPHLIDQINDSDFFDYLIANPSTTAISHLLNNKNITPEHLLAISHSPLPLIFRLQALRRLDTLAPKYLLDDFLNNPPRRLSPKEFRLLSINFIGLLRQKGCRDNEFIKALLLLQKYSFGPSKRLNNIFEDFFENLFFLKNPPLSIAEPVAQLVVHHLQKPQDAARLLAYITFGQYQKDWPITRGQTQQAIFQAILYHFNEKYANFYGAFLDTLGEHMANGFSPPPSSSTIKAIAQCNLGPLRPIFYVITGGSSKIMTSREFLDTRDPFLHFLYLRYAGKSSKTEERAPNLARWEQRSLALSNKFIYRKKTFTALLALELFRQEANFFYGPPPSTASDLLRSFRRPYTTILGLFSKQDNPTIYYSALFFPAFGCWLNQHIDETLSLESIWLEVVSFARSLKTQIPINPEALFTILIDGFDFGLVSDAAFADFVHHLSPSFIRSVYQSKTEAVTEYTILSKRDSENIFRFPVLVEPLTHKSFCERYTTYLEKILNTNPTRWVALTSLSPEEHTPIVDFIRLLDFAKEKDPSIDI